jgi:hypothetical protein
VLIGAYYYAWYFGRWLHKTKRASDTPILGEYSNNVYGQTLDEHMSMAKQAGIDFMAVSWAHNLDYGYIMDAAQKSGIKITALYESLQRATGKYQTIIKRDHSNILRDLEAISDDFEEDCWLRIGGKPVLMIYVSRNYQEPNDIFGEMRKKIGDVYLVGDEVFWGDKPDPNRYQAFDAITSYNWYQPGRFVPNKEKETCDSFLLSIREFLNECNFTRPYWPVAMPGYDDSSFRPQANHPPIPRLDGYFFEESLKDAITMNPDCLMITSFNEFYEDSEIEPVQSYGNKYLDILSKVKK